MKKARELADKHGCGIQIHIAEIPRAFLVEKYGKSAPRVLEEAGLLGPDVVAAHCIDLIFPHGPEGIFINAGNVIL
jgi:5-methylthioadenosine/S-adenosylhomocysteine deaminase